MSEMRVVYRKYGGSLHWNHPGRLLGEDEHGVWIGCPAGMLARRGHEPPTVFEFASVMLFPRDAWWTAAFNARPHDPEIYCDVSTVPQWRDDEVTMVDLDLDVLRFLDGRVHLDDEDEFADHQVTYGYPEDIVSQAERSAAWLMEAVGAGAGPFGGAHTRWLSLVT
ncbi:domain/protein associated with RNAses G and E [Microbispora sp. ATCC PTA-5024]|nr:domain/protein associated with RNAses G and E [Microbispora sp. ATCC PTA-5024]